MHQFKNSIGSQSNTDASAIPELFSDVQMSFIFW